MKRSLLFQQQSIYVIVSMLLCVHGLSSANGNPSDHTQFGLPDNAIARIGKGMIEDIALSPDGKKLAVASSIGIWLYDTQIGDAISLLTGQGPAVRSVAFSPDGVTIAGRGGLGDNNSIRLWDTRTGEQRILSIRNKEDVGDLVFSPDGLLLMSGGRSGNVSLWNTITGEREHILTGNTKQVLEIAISPDGNTVAIASLNNKIYSWNVESRRLKHIFTGHTDRVDTIAFSPDGTNLASAGKDGTIRFWNPDTGQLRKTIDVQEKVIDSIMFSPDSSILASGSSESRKIKFWNVTIGQQESSLTLPGDGALKILYSPDEKTIVSLESGENIHLINLETGANKFSIKGDFHTFRALAYAIDGKTLASTNGASVELWDVETKTHKRTLKGFQKSGIASMHSLEFSPDNRTLASADWDGIINLWDFTTGKHKQVLEGYAKGISSIAFSSDGKLLATANSEKTINIWNTNNYEQILTIEKLDGGPFAAAFSPDNQTLASVGSNGIVSLWNVTDGEQKMTIQTQGNGNSIAYSPNGVLIATSGQTTKIWHAITGQEILNLDPGTMENIKGQMQLASAAGDLEKMRRFHECLRVSAHIVAFSPVGNKLAVLRENGVINLWDIETQILIKTFTEHKSDVETMVFSPDGKTIASGSADGSLLILKVPE